VGPAPASPPDLQQALQELSAGRNALAEHLALAAAQSVGDPAPRAWLVVAEARQRRGEYAEAITAYRKYLAACDSADLRQYAVERIRRCESARHGPTVPRVPSRQLGKDALRRLAHVSRRTYMESSDHFRVRARNPDLAKLITEEGEIALRRICRELLGGQEYPLTVDVYVWADRDEYAANAPAEAPEWSGGCSSITYEYGLPSPRIDLTQLNAEDEFSTVMLDRVLPHELCHLVLSQFLGDAPCPLLIHEGLAMLAECGADTDRLVLAGTALAGKGKIPLERLLILQRRATKDQDQALFYAEAFSFLEFLHDRMSRREFRAFLEHVRDGCTVTEAIQRALYLPQDEQFLPALALAWEDYALEQAQVLRALSSVSPPALGP